MHPHPSAPDVQYAPPKKCPKCGHPGGQMYCEKCFGPRKEDEK